MIDDKTETTLNAELKTRNFVLETDDNRRLADLCGQHDRHLRQLEQSLGVEINNRGRRFQVVGQSSTTRRAQTILSRLFAETARGPVTSARVNMLIQELNGDDGVALVESPSESSSTEVATLSAAERDEVVIRSKRHAVRVRSENQQRYVRSIRSHDMAFGVGPAGTGKTYLAVACAVEALESEKVQRMLLVRPAVEAGERLGFLPGDVAQKIDPYLRPLYDALYEMLGFERVVKLIERNVIEVAPLAYMRGRTLNDAFIILDEAQNTTVEQMKMFLTRIGFGSKAVITGDITQVDLPRGKQSGLRHALRVLKAVPGIGFTLFGSSDVVRHPLVQKIVLAYEQSDEEEQPHVVPPSHGDVEVNQDGG